METSGEVREATVVEAKDAGTLSIAALTADLKALVDQLEADWADRVFVRSETAARVHELRERAERLFGNFE